MTRLSSAFSLLSFDTKHMMILQCMTEKKDLNSCMSESRVRRIMVLSWYDQGQTSLIHVRIRSLRRRNMTKETKEMLIEPSFLNGPFVLKRGRPAVKPLNLPFEMVHAWPCMADTSCNVWCQKKEDKLNFVPNVNFFDKSLQFSEKLTWIYRVSFFLGRTVMSWTGFFSSDMESMILQSSHQHLRPWYYYHKWH